MIKRPHHERIVQMRTNTLQLQHKTMIHYKETVILS